MFVLFPTSVNFRLRNSLVSLRDENNHLVESAPLFVVIKQFFKLCLRTELRIGTRRRVRR